MLKNCIVFHKCVRAGASALTCWGRIGSWRRSCLCSPSILLPTEAHNYAFNPAHPEFDAPMQVDEVQPLNLDLRIEVRLAEESS